MPTETIRTPRAPLLFAEDSVVKDAEASATEIPAPTLAGEPPADSEAVPATLGPVTGGLRFWLIFAALMVSTFLSAIDFVSLSMALMTGYIFD